MKKIGKLLRFVELTHEFQKIERTIFAYSGSERLENDMEHSYSLAMFAWYIIDSEKLKLNKLKVLQYSLAHDLVEVYAGDTYVHSTDKKHLEEKPKREKKAAMRLKKRFPEFQDMHKAIHDYELKKDRESRFIYALDKIQPLFNLYLDRGRMWHIKKVTFEMMLENKTPKVSVSPEIKKYFEELVALIKKEEKNLFPR